MAAGNGAGNFTAKDEVKGNGLNKGDKTKLKNNDIADAPHILRPWIYLYRAVPQVVKVPGVGDITFSVFCGAFLHIVRLNAMPIMIDVFGWPAEAKETGMSVGSIVAMTHAILLLGPLFTLLLLRPARPCTAMTSVPLWWKDTAEAMIQLCTGYMLQDTLVTYTVGAIQSGQGLQFYDKGDIMVLIHHFISVSYLLSVLRIGAGHYSVMMLMIIGECTNPAFNSFQMSERALALNCCGATPELHQLLSVLHGGPYFFCRGVAGPFIAVYVVYDMVLTKEGRRNVPVGWSVYYSICTLGVLFGSIPTTKQALNMCLEFFNGESQEL